MAQNLIDKEMWLPVEGWSHYSVSDRGNVRNEESGRLLKPRVGKLGYARVVLCRNGAQKEWLVHRLVLHTFVGEKPADKETNHKNCKRADNRLENLEYVTRQENASYREAHGKSSAGEGNSRARLSLENVIEIRERCARGEMQRDLGREFAVSPSTIWHAVTGRTWASALHPSMGG